jgi:hypothetical protein
VTSVRKSFTDDFETERIQRGAGGFEDAGL